ncbi:similar to Saccharomyces cerevisiae YDR277C MTH1 Negative regulator of the glucose-sensing signal transduction pathway, required for repression of transcription by Rgt1p [Maudiozyma saulgeensis]|uniref:Similar to Saccharomyces cerevisiae YDR277C MTH1 Negative regulator of the glucose-sensing signal transduction pathway, required for repression of transcription by Rgt1p n=1 Tax=Maudiozyma saulgeensis TaxID=1789683 RepID=A0A1X7QXX6_9SACH|nr:similar to Saccharomyces cerevisiae YDR277C MTH1 Negative regulator of the glucose-sensing signal transduction pathway, required for repression of transcription by Rgt1p [Kazachstania saulgeensis]
MFVSPPPTYLIRQSSHKKQSKRRDAQFNDQDINSNYDGSSSINSNTSNINNNEEEQPQQAFHIPSLARKEANFVSAPTEYADRARVEIRKRLLQQSPNSKNLEKIKSHQSSSNSSIQQQHSIDNESIFSDNASSYQSSIFSAPNTVQTQNSDNSLLSHQQQKFVTHMTLEEALPKTFFDMYAPELFTQDPSKILYNGRPTFTKRELLDWDLNDIRSLLIIDQSRPEWGNKLPEIITNESNLPNFRFILLPLCSTDEFIINILVNSDLYIEANLDYEFKLTSAKYTVAAARKRHEQMTGQNELMMNLSKPEWRNIIENYLLNIAVEAQCRFDFKQQCSDFKKWKIQQTNLKKPDMPPPSVIPMSMHQRNGAGSNTLLKKALMKNMQMKNIQQQQQNSIDNTLLTGNNSVPVQKVSLTKEEKASIWSHCQAQVYQRLDLDWKPDGVR